MRVLGLWWRILKALEPPTWVPPSSVESPPPPPPERAMVPPTDNSGTSPTDHPPRRGRL